MTQKFYTKPEILAYANRRRDEGMKWPDILTELKSLVGDSPCEMKLTKENVMNYANRLKRLASIEMVEVAPASLEKVIDFGAMTHASFKTRYKRAKAYARRRRALGYGCAVIASELAAMGYRGLGDVEPSGDQIRMMVKGVKLPHGRKRVDQSKIATRPAITSKTPALVRAMIESEEPPVTVIQKQPQEQIKPRKLAPTEPRLDMVKKILSMDMAVDDQLELVRMLLEKA